MRRAVVGVAVAVALGAGLALWTLQAPPKGTPAPEPVVAPVDEVVLPERWVPPDVLPDTPPDEESFAAAHAELGAALGLVPLRCYVGEAYDGLSLTGRWMPAIEEGWYSDVVDTFVGTRVVEMRVPGGEPEDPEFEHLFYVSWQATTAGQVATCTVEPILRGEIVVTALDQHGKPLQGLRVAGCGATEVTDADGRAELIGVKADKPCSLLAYCEKDARRACLPALPAEPLQLDPDEVYELTLDVEVIDMDVDPERALDLMLDAALKGVRAPDDLNVPRLSLPAGETLAALEGLTSDAGTAAERDLFARLLAKERRVQELSALAAESAALREEQRAKPDDPSIAEALAEVEAEMDALRAP
ncbi:MAG: hypothetical protein EP330_01760 [Deltaproteobacteria bacterium]|nr:MAG: hypothetical protein EP330_01760 [Deltaproteobacteria bacterium]